MLCDTSYILDVGKGDGQLGIFAVGRITDIVVAGEALQSKEELDRAPLAQASRDRGAHRRRTI